MTNANTTNTTTLTSTPTTAIVTYGRGWPALAVVRSLGAQGVRVVCGDSVACAPSTFSKYCAASFRYPEPSEDLAGFLDAIEAQVRAAQERGDEVVLLPAHSETYAIAANAARFEALGARMTLPTHAMIEAVRDKGRLAVLAESLGIEIPVTRRYTTLEQVYQDAHQVSFPAFVKIRGAAAGVGVIKVEDPESLVTTYRELVEGYELAPEDYPLVQEFCAGDDYCVSALFDHGKPVALHTYRNVRQFPATIGAGVLRESVRAPEAEAIAVQLLSHLEWHGLAQLDFRWAEGESPALIEVNPRLFGGLPQAIAAGVDHPGLMVQLALGETPTPPQIDYSVRTETPVLATLATLGAAAPGGVAEALRHPVQFVARLREELREHKGTINDVIRMDDPWPVLGILYPVTVALKHRSLSTALVLSEQQAKAAPIESKGLRGHLQPSWRTLLATAAVFFVSVFATHWGALDGSLLDRLFSVPFSATAKIAPNGAAPGYALFHVLNFGFLWCLAALGLKAREQVAGWPKAIEAAQPASA